MTGIDDERRAERRLEQRVTHVDSVSDVFTPPADCQHEWTHSNSREADICVRCWEVVPWGP